MEYREIISSPSVYDADAPVLFEIMKASDEAPLAQELKIISGVRIKVSEPLARYTSMKVGGPADFFKMAQESTNTLVIPTK